MENPYAISQGPWPRVEKSEQGRVLPIPSLPISRTMNTQETQSEKFRTFAKKVLSVPKAEIDRREKEYKKQRKKEKRRKL